MAFFAHYINRFHAGSVNKHVTDVCSCKIEVDRVAISRKADVWQFETKLVYSNLKFIDSIFKDCLGSELRRYS